MLVCCHGHPVGTAVAPMTRCRTYRFKQSSRRRMPVLFRGATFSRPASVWRLQVNVESLPDGPKNPHGVGFVANETVLRSEKQAQRMGDLNTSRIWKIKNPNSINPLNGAPHGNGPLHTASL